MSLKLKTLWQGLTGVFSMAAVLSMTTGQILEANKATIDSALGTQSTILISEDGDGLYKTFPPNDEFVNKDEDGNITSYNTKAFLKAQIQLGRRSGYEGSVLLKNENNVLPLAKNSNVTLLGVRSNRTFLGSNQGVDANGQMVSLARALSGTTTDFSTEVAKGSTLPNADNFQFSELNLEGRTDGAGAGFNINEAMLERYKNNVNGSNYNESPGASKEIALSLIEDVPLTGYQDAAIVVIGRASSESSDYGRPTATNPGNLALSQNEKDLLNYATENFNKVVVLVNTNSPMEIREIKDNPKIQSILWIGHLGCFGSLGVADILCGRVSPSGALADTYSTYGMSSPASVNFGTYSYSNASGNVTRSNSSNYCMEAEGIYTGYRYYETRYYDAVNNKGNAKGNSGIWASEGETWDYEKEMVYTFGYGLSYTTFKFDIVSAQTETKPHEKYTKFIVKVTNTGNVEGATPVQIYGKAPYTHSDDLKQLQKPAVQLLEFGKTGVLAPGASQQVEIEVDWQNIASYDETYVNADGSKGTYVLDNGDYLFTVANGAHEAVNNFLLKEGHAANELVGTGNKDLVYVENFRSADGKATDANTFGYSKSGVKIQNQIPYADYNWYETAEDEEAPVVTYLTRNDWVGTYPIEYTGDNRLIAKKSMLDDLNGRYYVAKTDQDTSDIVWNQMNTDLMFYDLALQSYDDPRWDDILDKISMEDAITMAAYGGNTFAAARSVGFQGGKLTENTGNGIQTYTPQNNLLSDECPWKVTSADNNGAISLKVFGSAVLMASSFSHEFLYKMGEFLGEEAILVGLPIIWGPGGNTHRSPYNGRTGEYYSEDPVLTGVACMEYAVGGRDKGLITSPKHYAFNDQESSRNGIAPYMTEQRARETELRAFQIAFEASSYDRARGEDTGMLGMMTSFSKIGGVECTCSQGLVRNIAVGEWNFKGYCVTDINDDFQLFDCVVMGGCTGYDNRTIGNPSWTLLSANGSSIRNGNEIVSLAHYAGDRDLQLAIKESCHRTLYTFCQSVLMNQYNSSTRLVEQETSWRIAYKTAIISTAVLAGLSAIAYVVFAFFLGKKGA
ncbi:MAG: glycoside hydrolase family 3 C-terminal domain-containing protein [Bacilli bacterium]|nr:glycoside hydrolase family 3 C-terminal domain-containing protein [Bacilli bacterium]